MVRPERRTKADLAVVALIVVAVLVGGAVIWLNSDARATVSETAAQPVPEPPEATSIPTTLTEAWRATSPVTPVPVVAGPAVVTGAGNEVLGHDPITGRIVWRYSRDLPLCTIGAEWDRALAVYRKSLNCSEVTSLLGPTGVRGPQRNSDAEFGTQLLADGTYVTATGQRSFESWRSDLVRTQQFGMPPAVKNPNNDMARPDCTYSSIAVGDERVGVVEQCPQEQGRITVLKAHPEDDEKPEEIFSVGLGSAAAGVVAVTDERVAVILRDRSEVAVFDNAGAEVAHFPVRVGPPDLRANVLVESTAKGHRIYWHTGADTVALDPTALTPLWTSPDTLGPGVGFAGKMLVPVRDGLAVLDPITGNRERVIPVDRAGYTGPVQLSAVGPIILEQRGDTLVALR
ncbi:Rv3212 family protein [Saccharopolyspora sp. 5N708]|uniref:Rv3212 family protein n=1 Tax=Saccharopolyspora sp. 5N708 TaxID=3457424 RepID=UPI003FCEF2A8